MKKEKNRNYLFIQDIQAQLTPKRNPFAKAAIGHHPPVVADFTTPKPADRLEGITSLREPCFTVMTLAEIRRTTP